MAVTVAEAGPEAMLVLVVLLPKQTVEKLGHNEDFLRGR